MSDISTFEAEQDTMLNQTLFILTFLALSVPLIAEPLVISCPHKSIPFRVETAQTPAEQAKGLMFREKLDEDAGMIFLYSTPRPVAMWMKNTPLPLDMIFGDEGGNIIAIHENATPHSLATIGPVEGVSHVTELNGGTVKKHGITKACTLKLHR
jgi:uncharacterized membrane protein (UPF0127 family)